MGSEERNNNSGAINPSPSLSRKIIKGGRRLALCGLALYAFINVADFGNSSIDCLCGIDRETQESQIKSHPLYDTRFGKLIGKLAGTSIGGEVAYFLFGEQEETNDNVDTDYREML